MNLKITDVRAHKGDSAFLIDNGRTAVLYDTGFAFTGYRVAENIKKELGNRSLDYIFLTHSHYDHAAGSAYILRHYPRAKVVASEYAAAVFKREGAKRVMRELDRKFASVCGVSQYDDLFDELTVHIAVNDGDVINAGDMQFTALELKGHTNCCMGYYLESEKLLLSCETLGVYDGKATIVPSFLVSFEDTLRSIEKAENMQISSLLLPHYGLLSEEQKNFYLQNARAASAETYEEIKSLLKEGKTKAQAVEYFRNKFYSDKIKAVYPEDAMLLNTSIMITLIARESGIKLEE